MLLNTWANILYTCINIFPPHTSLFYSQLVHEWNLSTISNQNLLLTNPTRIQIWFSLNHHPFTHLKQNYLFKRLFKQSPIHTHFSSLQTRLNIECLLKSKFIILSSEYTGKYICFLVSRKLINIVRILSRFIYILFDCIELEVKKKNWMFVCGELFV